MQTDNYTDDQFFEDLFNGLQVEETPFDDRDEVFESIMSTIEKRKGIHRLQFSFSMAAAVAVLVGLFFWSNATSKSGNDPLTLEMPCGSRVALASNASIHYNKIGWYFTRNVSLSGDATFEVTKGRKFTVTADRGTITVLGTKFSVNQASEEMKVECFEGSVSVATAQDAVVLKQGDCVSSDGNSLSLNRQDELPEYISFTDASLLDVLDKIESVFGVKIDNVSSCGDFLFTGDISTKNLSETLEVVFGTCGLNYSVDGDSISIDR